MAKTLHRHAVQVRIRVRVRVRFRVRVRVRVRVTIRLVTAYGLLLTAHCSLLTNNALLY